MMKRWISIILLVLGLVCVACGLYGFYVVANTRVESILGISFDEARALMRTVKMTFPQRLTLFCLDSRLGLIIGGAVAIIAGVFVKRSERK